MSQTNYAFNEYIKKVLIEFPDYKFHHRSISKMEKGEDLFLWIKEKLKALLKSWKEDWTKALFRLQVKEEWVELVLSAK